MTRSPSDVDALLPPGAEPDAGARTPARLSPWTGMLIEHDHDRRHERKARADAKADARRTPTARPERIDRSLLARLPEWTAPFPRVTWGPPRQTLDGSRRAPALLAPGGR